MFTDYPGRKRVPNFVGLDYNAARKLELTSGWSTRDPDPDAPSISNYWWSNQQLVVATQVPPAGSLLRRDEPISITLEDPQGLTSTSAATVTPPRLQGHATD